MEEDRKIVLGTLRETFGRICWTHKTHEKAREFASDAVCVSKWISVVLTFLTLITLIVSIKNPTNESIAWATIVIAVLAFGFQVFNLSFNPEKDESSQRDAAKTLLRLREGYLILITRTMAGENLESIKIDFVKLSDQLVLAYTHLPNTSSRDFKAASEAIKDKDEIVFSDKEIDLLLPTTLRISKE